MFLQVQRHNEKLYVLMYLCHRNYPVDFYEILKLNIGDIQGGTRVTLCALFNMLPLCHMLSSG
jgi:hypothetical protein